MSHADAFFAIGKSHMVCQDYARAGTLAPPPRSPLPLEENPEPTLRSYAIVSDGCSSSPDTDHGSRLLTVAAVNSLNTFGEIRDEWVIWRAKYRGLDPLPERCLDATLLVAYETEDGVQVSVSGDGVIIAARRDGTFQMYEIDFSGAPGYLSYLLDGERLQHYLEEGYGQRKITHWPPHQQPRTREVCGISFEEGSFSWKHTFSRKTFEMVMVLSDGVLSFQDSNHQRVPLETIAPHLLDIRVKGGEFIKRAHRFFLTKTCPKLGWHHNDDFGAAAIMLDEPE